MFIGDTTYEINRFMEALDAMAHFDETEKIKLCKKFKKALFHQNPSKAFSFIGEGVYKKCYALDDKKHFVIKFCEATDASAEIATLIHAAKDNVKELFINGSYFNIRCCCMQDNCNCVVIQPRIAFTAEHDPIAARRYCAHYSYQYEEHLLYDKQGNALSYTDFANARVSCVAWLQAVINTYGIDTFYKFCTFVNTYDIDDLHTENIAYMECEEGGYVPIIIDWAAFQV